MPSSSPVWICCQLGAREHYAIPRALHQMHQLGLLVTDAWVSPQSPLHQLPGSSLKQLRERFHPELAQAPIHHSTGSLIRFEIQQRLNRTTSWDRIIARNNWFQRQVCLKLNQISPQFTKLPHPPVVFAYSYAALKILQVAKARGWHTVLGQIDPGPIEEQIVLAEQANYPQYQSNWQPAPAAYWKRWHEECALADQIVVNSTWSGQALQQLGIAANKIHLVPLCYESSVEQEHFTRIYPSEFSAQRPLRVLFLGQLIIRKGIVAVLEVAQLLQQEPIEFWLVGSQGIQKPQALQPNIRWIGPVPRSETHHYYQQADVFLFPTLSDGFGLTQLEAQAWNLPIVASGYCGEVVKDMKNGLVLPEVTATAIAKALLFCLKHPQQLQAFSRSSVAAHHNLAHLKFHLKNLIETN